MQNLLLPYRVYKDLHLALFVVVKNSNVNVQLSRINGYLQYVTDKKDYTVIKRNEIEIKCINTNPSLKYSQDF